MTNAAPEAGIHGADGWPTMLVRHSEDYTTIRISTDDGDYDYYFAAEDGEFDGVGIELPDEDNQ